MSFQQRLPKYKRIDVETGKPNVPCEKPWKREKMDSRELEDYMMGGEE